VANAVTGELRARVGGVLAPHDAALAQKLLDLAAVDLEEGPDDSLAGYRPDPGQTRTSGSAHKSEQDGLRLVRDCMAHGDTVDCAAFDHLPKKIQPGAAGSLFQISRYGRPPQVRLPKLKRQAQVRCQTPDEFRILPGLTAPKLVIDVEDRQLEVPRWSEFQKDV
jgi:hypothetical protein